MYSYFVVTCGLLERPAVCVRAFSYSVCLHVHRWGLVVRASLDWPINYGGLLMMCNEMIY